MPIALEISRDTHGYVVISQGFRVNNPYLQDFSKWNWCWQFWSW